MKNSVKFLAVGACLLMAAGTLAGCNDKDDLKGVADVSSITNLTFELDSKTKSATISSADWTDITELEIPKYVKSKNKKYTVNIIGKEAFKNSTLSKITLPDSIIKIDDYAFTRATNLAEINMPESLKSIGYAAFAYTAVSDIDLTNVEEIGDRAFDNCKQISSLDLNNLTNLGYGAFNESSITSIKMPSIVRLEGYAFRNCTSLEEVVVSNCIENIESQAFYGCTNIVYKEINNGNYLGSETKDAIVYVSPIDATQTSYTVEDGCKIINYGAFNNNSVVESVEMPDTIVCIGTAAFNWCTKLNTTLPSNLKYIYNGAFQYCPAMKNIAIPSGVEFIGDFAFNHCYGAENTSLTIPAGIKQIGGGYNYDPENPNLDVIGTHIFYDAATNYLREFVLDENNENFITIDGVLYRKDAQGNPSVLISYPADKRDSRYVMPNTVVDAFELSMSRPYYLREIVLSDSFVIKDMADDHLNKTWTHNLGGALYVYSGITTLTCNNTNENYMSYNGQVYSKDGTILYFASDLVLKSEEETVLTFKEGVTTFAFGSLTTDTPHRNNYVTGNNLDEANHMDVYDKIIIPASVTTIDEVTLANINAQSWTIEVADGNTSYQVNASGKLEKIAA